MSHWEQYGKTDEWYTPRYIFDAMACQFTMDVASPVVRTWCQVPAFDFITENSLQKEWKGFVWMNPPFGGRNGLSPWLDKLYNHGNGIALTPDRTSAPWWQKAAIQCHCILFVAGKVKFVRPDGSYGKQPSNGTTLLGYGINAKKALMNAERNGLGILFEICVENNLRNA